MIYYSEIYSKRHKKIRVEIYSKSRSTSEPQELTLRGSEPIMIEYESDNIFKPLKQSRCTINVVTRDPLFDLYTGKANEIYCKVYKDDEFIWFGFLTPNVYSCSYNIGLNTFSLEFIDPIAQLENVKFTKSGEDSTFRQYFERGFNTLVEDLSLEYYISSLCRIDLDNIGCYQRNFIDETNDEDNGAMSWKDVFQSIMEYLGLTMVMYGTKVYLLSQAEQNEIQTVQYLNDYGVADSDCTVSLGDIYNKITIIENTNPIDSVFDKDLFDEESLQEFMDETDPHYLGTNNPYGSNLEFYRVTQYTVEDPEDQREYPSYFDSKGRMTYIFVDDKGVGKMKLSDTWNTYYDLRAAYIPNNNWTVRNGSFEITKVGDTYKGEITNPKEYVDATANRRFASFTASDSFTVNGTPTSDGYGIDAGAFIYYGYMHEVDNMPSKIDWDKKLYFYTNNYEILGNSHWREAAKNTVFLKYKSPNRTLLKGGYLIFNVNYEYRPSVMTAFDMAKTVNKANSEFKYILYGNDVHPLNSIYLRDDWKLQLKVGNKYYNGTNWTTEESTFIASRTFKKSDELFYNAGTLKNYNTYEMNLQDTSEGYAIPIDENLFGELELTVYAPTNFGQSAHIEGSPDGKDEPEYVKLVTELVTGAVCISDLKLSYTNRKLNGNGVFEGNSQSDIKICSIIDTDNVMDYGDITLTVNTYSSLQPSYSYAIDMSNPDFYEYLGEIDGKIQEQYLVEKYAQYYTLPRLQYKNCINEYNGNNRISPFTILHLQQLNKNLITDGLTYDLKDDSVTVELKEIL